MNQTLTQPRPTVTDEMIRLATLKLAPRFTSSDDPREVESVVNAIVEQYRHPMDGFELALQLSKYEGWDVTRDEMEELDSISYDIRVALAAAEKAWFASNQIEPPFPVGTEITRGTIASIYEHGPAKYCVKERGCTQEGRFLLIDFEDAKAKPE